jgi:nitrogen fixation-related uncharacterized protein
MVAHIIGGIYGWSVGNGLFDDASYDAQWGDVFRQLD